MDDEQLCQMFVVRARERISKFRQCLEYVRKEARKTENPTWDKLGELMLQNDEEKNKYT